MTGGDSEPDFMSKPPYSWQSDSFKPTYRVACWCGKVQFDVQGDPANAKACHCKVSADDRRALNGQTCQHLHGAAFQHAVLFHKNAFRLAQNEDDSLTFFSCGDYGLIV